jgi:hypothetical protein
MVDEQSNIHLITNVTRDDVVLGRGAGPNEHAGNIAFREVVNEFKPLYTATINRKAKCQIAQNVLKVVKARRGRFLKRAPGRPDTDETYVLADDEVVLEKAKQALRHGTKGTAPSRLQAGPSRRPPSPSLGARRNLGQIVDLGNHENASSSEKVSPTRSLSAQFQHALCTPSTGIDFPATMGSSSTSVIPEASPIGIPYDSLDSASIQTILQVLIAAEEQRRQDSLSASILNLSQFLAGSSDTSIRASPLPHSHSFLTNISISMLSQDQIDSQAMESSMSPGEVAKLLSQYSLLSDLLASSETRRNVGPAAANTVLPDSSTSLEAASLLTYMLAGQNVAAVLDGLTNQAPPNNNAPAAPASLSYPSSAPSGAGMSSILGALLSLQKQDS